MDAISGLGGVPKFEPKAKPVMPKFMLYSKTARDRRYFQRAVEVAVTKSFEEYSLHQFDSVVPAATAETAAETHAA